MATGGHVHFIRQKQDFWGCVSIGDVLWTSPSSDEPLPPHRLYQSVFLRLNIPIQLMVIKKDGNNEGRVSHKEVKVYNGCSQEHLKPNTVTESMKSVTVLVIEVLTVSEGIHVGCVNPEWPVATLSCRITETTHRWFPLYVSVCDRCDPECLFVCLHLGFPLGLKLCLCTWRFFPPTNIWLLKGRSQLWLAQWETQMEGTQAEGTAAAAAPSGLVISDTRVCVCVWGGDLQGLHL